MKNIFFIGDSIMFGAEPNSSGYGVCVKEKLAGKAQVFYPEENCRFTQYTLRYLHEWASGIDCGSIDIVHWNNGLWDVLRLFGDEPFTSIDEYGNMLKRIYKRIRLVFPNANIIFALSTSVNETQASPDFIRLNCDIELYNQRATEVMNELGVKVNDLYSVSLDLDDAKRCDWVHFSREGCEILADTVIKAINN